MPKSLSPRPVRSELVAAMVRAFEDEPSLLLGLGSSRVVWEAAASEAWCALWLEAQGY